MGFMTGWDRSKALRLQEDANTLARQQHRQNVRAYDDQQNLKLHELGVTKNESGGYTNTPGGQMELMHRQQQLANTRYQSMQQQVSLMQTKGAWEEYSKTGSVLPFQRLLSNNSYLSKAWEEYAQEINPVDFKNDGQLLAQFGVGLKYLENPEFVEALNKNIFKYRRGNTWEIGSIPQLMAMTGGYKNVPEQVGKYIDENTDRIKRAMDGTLYTSETDRLRAKTEQFNAVNERDSEERKDANVTYANTTDRLDVIGNLDIKQQKPDQNQTPGQPTSGVNPVKSKVGNYTQAEQNSLDNIAKYEAVLKDKTISSTKRRNIEGLLSLEHIVLASGGEEEFYKKPFTDEERRRVQYHLTLAKNLLGKKPTTKENEVVSFIRQINQLAPSIKKLTPGATGLIDDTVKTISEYVAGGDYDAAQATAAYTVVRNALRYSLYGSALTATEVQAFAQQFGDLGLRYGAVMSKFRTNLISQRAKLSSVMSNYNSRLAHVVFGYDLKSLNEFIDGIDNTLAVLDNSDGIRYRPLTEDELKARQDKKLDPTDSDVIKLNELWDAESSIEGEK